MSLPPKKTSKISLSMKKKITTPKTVRFAPPTKKAQILSDVVVVQPSTATTSCLHIKQQPPPLLPLRSMAGPSLPPLLDDQYSIITIHSDDESGARQTEIRAVTIEDHQLSQLMDELDATSTVQQNRVYPPQIRSPSPTHPPPAALLTSKWPQNEQTTTSTSIALTRSPGGKSLETMLQVYGVGKRLEDDEDNNIFMDFPTAATPKQVAQATYARLLKMVPIYERRMLEARDTTQRLSVELAASRENEAAIQGEVEYINKLMTFLVNNL
ncbi:hypothetical protein PPYR_05922 [Photinus pyralis]|uniref:Uncharacterized protein n=1 Tax=Photinus pyralis TaxID=7054 RepID=A0A5N4AS49_PHOPY|nr:uncharacterized protein LOC116166704 [Photinus pyralis]XP_031358720.1 uncharacterized protein LOC116182331 [Photinus pyralis]KAB0800182.1 hypothetical protein PPYR_05922 [Photinus pyralis]